MPSTCHDCGAELTPGALFCGGCGARQPEPAEDPAAVERFREVLARFAAAGGLGGEERQQLAALQQRLGLSPATCERLLQAVDAAPEVRTPLRMFVDVATLRHFRAGARCLVRLRVHNDGDLAFERVEIRAALTGGPALDPACTGTLFPGHHEVVGLWMVPDVAGYAELTAAVEVVDLAGDASHYRATAVQFRVGDGAGPQVQIVHIDQSSARVVDNSRSTFGGDGDGTAGPIDGGDWRPVALEPDTPALSDAPVVARRRFAPVDFAVTTDGATYQVTSTLAQGDISTVYGGHVRGEPSRRVAVKVADDPADNDLMTSEVRVLELLTGEDSPQRKHLPVVLDRFRTGDGRLGTVFEALDGFDLVSIRQRLPGGIPPRHMVWLFRRCLSVLGWAHSRGVLHGNLDPAHVVIRPQDHNVWVLDWCWAVVNPARTGQGFRALNEVYSPPEVAEGKPPIPASDLYALGKTMIFAAGGDPERDALPEGMDERMQRYFRFFVRDSPLGRAQDAWQMYAEMDRLREELWGPHEFVEFEV